MKQHITPKQAQELTEEQFYSLFEELVIRNRWFNYHHTKVTIGKMLEILSSHFGNVSIISGSECKVTLPNKKTFKSRVLCDALWDAVKYTVKLK